MGLITGMMMKEYSNDVLSKTYNLFKTNQTKWMFLEGSHYYNNVKKIIFFWIVWVFIGNIIINLIERST